MTIKEEKESIHKDFQHIAKQLAKYKAAYKKLVRKHLILYKFYRKLNIKQVNNKLIN